MAQALPLEEEEHVPGSGINWDALGATKESSWGDYKDVLDIGAYGVAEAVGGAGQFVTGGSDDSVFGRLRRWAGEGADANYRELSPEAQRNFSAGFLPNAERSDIWDDDVSVGSAVGLKLTAAVPSLAAALIPGGLAARVALAAGASRAGAGAIAGAAANVSSGAQTGGSLYSDITDAILQESDFDLQKENEIYRGMRASGLSEEDAKAQVIQSAAGFLPLYMSALTIMTGKVGVEGMLAKGITGQGARRGVLKAAGIGAIGEGGQEGLESATQEVLTQKGKVDAAVTGAHFDWYKALEAAAEGLATGGVLGAGVNAVVGRGRDPVADLDPAVAGTLDGTINTPTVPAPDQPTESPDVTAGKIAAIQRPPEPGEVVPAVPSATAPTPVAEVVGTTAPIFEKVSGVSAAEAAAMAAPQSAGGTTPARENIATQTDVGYDPDADIEESPAPPPIPPSPPPSPETHAITAVDPTKDVRGQPLPAPPPAPVAPAAAPAGPVPIGPALAEAGYIAPDVAVPPVTPQVSPQPAAAASSLTPEERAAYEAEINARVGVKPTGRVLTDEAAEAAAAAEAAQKAKMARPGERMTKQKQARAEAGLPVMTAQEARKYDREQKRIKIAGQTKAALESTPYDMAKMTTPKAIRAYITDLLSKIPDYKEAKTSRFTDEDDPHLKLLAMARGVRASSDMDKLGDFMRTDYALRQGVDIVSDYRKTEAKKTAPTVVEEMGGTTEDAPAIVAVQEDSEPEPTPEEDRAREKAEFDAKMAARRAESAKVTPKVTEAPKREVTVQKVRNVKELRAKALAKERAEFKARAEQVAAQEPRSKFAAPTEVKAEAALAEQTAQEMVESPPVQEQVRPLIIPEGGIPSMPTRDEIRAANAARGRPISEAHINQILVDLREVKAKAEEALTEREGIFREPIRMSLKELMSQKESNAFKSKFQRGYARFLQARVAHLVGDTPVVIVDRPTMAKIFMENVRLGIATTGQLPAGFYYKGEIVINGTLEPQQFTHTLLHETIHAAYEDALTNRGDVQGHIRELMKSIKMHFESPDGIINVPEDLQYALTNEHEFLSEALSNPEVQALLEKIPSRGGDRFLSSRYRGGRDEGLRTLWDDFVGIMSKIVGKLLGRDQTVLAEIMKAHRELDFEAQDDANFASGGELRPLIARDKVAAAREAITPRGSLKRQSMGLALQTFDNIRQRYPGLFPTSDGDALERLNDGLRKAARTGDKIREDAMKMAERFRVLPPEVKDKVADLVTNITTHNINVGPGANNDHLKSRRVRNRKSISEVPKAQAAYDALPAEAQTWIREAGAFYRDIENQTRHEHLTQMLKLQEKTYAPSTYSSVVNAVMDGKLTDEHRAMLDDDNLFTALRDLTGFARIKGYYFPLARHGDVVVNTYDDLGDIGSGKVLTALSDKRSKVIEWTGNTDKEAEDAYNAYIDSTDLVPPTSVGKIWRDMQGNEISAKDAKGVAHTVSYRARMHVQGTYFFDTEKEALAFHKENPRSTPPMQKAQYRGGQDMNNQQLAAIMKGVQRSNADPAQKAMMESILRDASIRLMSGGRVQKHRLKRLGAKGASSDLARTTFDYANTAGGYLGKVRHMPEIRAVLAEMHKIVDGYDDKDKPLRGQILDEMHQRIDDNVFDPQSYPKWIQRLLAISFIDKLASPAYSIINATQVMMVTYPVLAGHHGPLKASLEIARAYRSMGALGTIGQGMMNVGRATKQFNKLSIDTSDLVGSLLKNVSKEKDGEFLRKVINYANERTPLAEAGMELAGSMMGGSKAIDMGLAKVDRIFRQMSLAVEVMNRGATLIAAGRLARLKMDEDAAIKFAFDTMQNTQGDYTPVNTPRAFKHPWAAPFLQFKRYAQMMSMLVYDMVKNAFAGATRADKVRAWRQIAGLVAVQVAMAGALGLPGMELAKIVLMAGAALGLTDGYDEFERYLQEVAKSALGESGGEMLTRGVISRGIGMAFGGHGIDLSSRLSLADMWTGFEEPKGTTKDDYMAYFGQLALGAPGSLAADWITGSKDMVDGNFGKAFEKLVPVKVVADLAKAVRGYGDPTASIPITAPEAILQGIGLRSGRMANRGEEIGKKIATQKDLEKDKKELNSLWMGATTKGEELKAQIRIAEHNKRVEKMYGKSGRAAQLKVHVKGLNKAKDERASERARVQGY